jgi:hypothetical protein
MKVSVKCFVCRKLPVEIQGQGQTMIPMLSFKMFISPCKQISHKYLKLGQARFPSTSFPIHCAPSPYCPMFYSPRYSNTSTFAASSFVASLFRQFSIITTFPNFVACFALSSHFVTTARLLVSFVVQSLNRSRSVCAVF